jgi:TrmH family RNA methyltransferase
MIRSRQNRKMKDMRRLRRRQGDLALLEGPHLVDEALAAGIDLEEIFLTPELAAASERAPLLARARCPVTEVAAELLRELADADSPQGALAVARLPRGGTASLPCREGGVYLFLDGVQDPGNLGALARVAEATGTVGMACAAGSASPNHPRALRASAGSLLRLPVAWPVTPEALEEHLAAARPRWIVLDPHQGEDLYATTPPAGTVLLALGAEGAGVSPQLAARASLRLRIPLAAPVESLNVVTAAAVTLFELRRRRDGLAAPATPSPP